MAGTAILFIYAAEGALVTGRLFDNAPRQIRLWLGICLGMACAMWFPALWAFVLKFGLASQIVSLAMMTALSFSVRFSKKPRRVAPKKGDIPDPPLLMTLLLVIPFTAFSCWLQYTHTLLGTEGALSVGQSTYGDLCLHLGIATGLRNSSFPPEYTLLPGTRLGYPFLSDALSSGMMLWGTSLRLSFIIPGTLFSALVYWGFVILAYEIWVTGSAAGICR